MSEETFRANVSQRADQEHEEGEEAGFNAGSGAGSADNPLNDTSAAAFFTGVIPDPKNNTSHLKNAESGVHSGGFGAGDRSF